MTLPTHIVSSIAVLKYIDHIAPEILNNKINLYAYIFFAIGSIFPDLIEIICSRFSFKRFFKIHRTYLHWWVLYITFFIIHLLFYYNNWFNYNNIHIPKSNIYLCSAVFLILLGSFLHLFEDYFSLTGIPYLRPKGQKMKKTLYSTGSIKEAIIFAFFLIVFLIGI